MLLFNMKYLESLGPVKAFEALKDSKLTIPKNKHHKLRNISGTSFILNPDMLIKSKVDILYKWQYLLLASKRDYAWYTSYGIKYLDLRQYPDLRLDLITLNPLLKLIDNKIFFRYEEI